jgi:hypothetical protein
MILNENITINSSFPRKKSKVFNYVDLNNPPVFDKSCSIGRNIDFDIPNNFLMFGLSYKYFNANYKLDGNSLNSTIDFNSLPSVSLNFSNNILLKKPFIFYYGVGLESVNLNFNTSLSGHKDAFLTSDPDAFNYLRKIDFLNHNESLENRYISVPFTLGLNSKITTKKNFIFNNLELDFKISFSPYFNYSSKLISKALINYSGYYENLFGITISENGVYDFGIHNFNIEKSVDQINNYSIDYRFGVCKKIATNTKIGLSRGKTFFLNNFNVFTDNNYISKDKTELNSVFSNIESFKVNLGYFELSLIYQF